jgi:hypothetical protein
LDWNITTESLPQVLHFYYSNQHLFNCIGEEMLSGSHVPRFLKPPASDGTVILRWDSSNDFVREIEMPAFEIVDLSLESDKIKSRP